MVGIQFQTTEEPAEQVDYTPQQNEDRTQHTPENSGLLNAIVIAVIAAFVVNSIIKS